MLVDTNVFVEQGTLKAFVTDFTPHSLAVILERYGQGERLPEAFFTLSAFKGLTLLQASMAEHGEIAVFAGRSGLDFDDAYQAYFALRLGVPVNCELAAKQ